MMELINAINERHSVRQYSDRPIEAELLKELQAEIEACNREGQLHIQLVTNEPKAFDGFMAHYGKFSGVKNYIALIGKKGKGYRAYPGNDGCKHCRALFHKRFYGGERYAVGKNSVKVSADKVS